MRDNNYRQKGYAVGIGHTINQNIINVYSTDELLQNCTLINSGYNSPRNRMQLSHKVELPGTIDIGIIKSKVKLANNWIKSAQNPEDYGLPTDDIGSESCSWASSGLLWSSWVAEGKTPEWWRKCLRWILSQSNSDNGIPIVRQNDSSITDATAFTLMCASAAGEEFSGSANKLSAWLLDMQNTGGWKWSTKASNYNFISTGLALLSLKFYFQNCGGKNDQIGSALHSGIKWIHENRNIDNGWGCHPRDSSRPANTGFITYVLSVLGQTNCANEAFPFLRSKFKENTGWDNSIDRPASHNVTRLGLPYTLLGLSTLNQSNERDHLLKAGIELLNSGFSNGVYVIQDTVARSWPTREFILSCSALLEI